MKKYIFSLFLVLGLSLFAYSQPRFINPNLPTRCAGTNQTDTLAGLTVGNDYVVYLMPGSVDSMVFNNVALPTFPFSFLLPANLSQGNYFFQLTKKGARNTVYDSSDVFRVDERIGITPNISASPTTICSGQSVAFTLSHNSSPYTYSLDYGDGSAVRNSPGLSDSKTYSLSTYGSGSSSYWAFFIVDNSTCPSKKDSVRITVKQKPFSQLLRTNSPWRTVISGDTTFTLCNQSGISTLELNNYGDVGTITNYQINWGDSTSTSNSTFPSPSAQKLYSTLGSKTISYTVTGNNGCSNSFNYGVYIGSNPAVGLGNPGNVTGGCIPQNYSFPITNTSSNTPGTQYTIFSSDSLSSTYTFNHPPPTSWNKNYAFSSCGYGPTPTGVNNSFYFQINAFNACGSSQALISPIQIDEKPKAGFTVIDPIICQGSTVSFQDRSVKGRKVNSSNNSCDSASTISYTIYKGNVPGVYYGIIPVGVYGGISSIAINLPGNYYAVQSVRNASGSCPAVYDTQYFCVQSPLYPRFNSNANPITSCAPVRYLLTNITDTSQTCNQKQWRWSVWDSLGTTPISSGTSGVTINNSTNNNGDIQFTNPGKYIIRLSATNDCGTFDTSMLVSIKRKPNLTISPNIAYCGNQSISFQSASHTFTADNGFGTITQYSWSSDSLAFSSATTAGITNTIALKAVNKCPKEYNLTIRATNECGISDPVTQKVTIYPPLTPDVISGFQMICKNAPANVITGTNHQYNTCRTFTYTWETATSGAGPWTTATGTSNGVNYNPGNISNTAGTYFFRRRVTDGVCSSITDTMSIVVKPSLDNNIISANQTICYGFTPNPLTGTTPTGANGTYTYQWQFSTNGGSTWSNVPSGGTSLNYSPGALFTTTSYKRIVQGTPCIGDTFQLISNVVVITITPFPTGVISFNPAVTCNNLPFTATLTPNASPTVSAYAWSSVGSPAITIGSPNSQSTLIIPANNQSGSSYSYTLICSLTSNQGCIDTVQKSFTIEPRPTAGFTIPATACPPVSINITNTATGGSIYFYSVNSSNPAFPATIDSSVSKVTPRISFPSNTTGGSLTYTILQKVFNATGCFDTISRIITIFPRPNARISSADSICAAGVLNISFNGATPPAITAYSWSITSNTTPVATITAPTAASTTITFPDQQGGSNQFLVLRQIVTTADGCRDTTNKAIWMLPRPLANLTTTDTAICAPASVTIANANPLTGASYQWTYASNPALSTNNQTIVNPTAASTLVNFGDRKGTRDTLYTFTHIINDSRGCKDTASINVNVHPRPTAVFGPVTGIDCTPKSVAFTNTSSGQLGASPYRWTINNTTYTSATPTHIFTNTGIIDSTYNTKLVVTSGFGCKDSTTGNYTIHPNPKARFSATSTSYCAPFRIDSLNIFDSLYTGTNGVYSWYVNGILVGTPSASSTGFPGYTINNANDSAMITLRVASRFACPAVDSMRMTFRTIPQAVPNFTMSTNAGCEPLIITLTSTTTPPWVAHLWQVGNQATIISGTNTSNTLTIRVNNPGTTNWVDSVRLKVTEGTGCTDSIKKSYTVYPKPNAGITSVDSICAAGVVNISHNGVTPPAITAYNWTITSNTTPVAAIAAPTSASTNITFPDQQGGSNQSITLRQIVTTSNSCADTATKTIWMLPRPLANLTTTDTAICAPASVTIANANPLTGASYQWSYTSNPAGSTNNQTILNPTAASTLVNFGDRKGTRDTLYSFTHIINDSKGCKDTATISVNVHPRPTAAFSPISGIDCTPKAVSFTNTSIGQFPSSYRWTINNTSYTSTTPTHIFTNTGVIDSTYNTKLVVTSIFGCKDSTTSNYTIHPNPKASISATKTTDFASFQIDSLNIRPTLFTGTNGVYSWYVNGNLLGSSASTTGFPGYTINNANDSVTIRLIVTSKFGCAKNDSMQMVFRTSSTSNPSNPSSVVSFLKFNYQGSLIDQQGKLYSNRNFAIRFTILDSNTSNFIETQSLTTDNRGHFATQVGAGTPIYGSIADITWWDGKARTLRTEIDTNSVGNWMVLGNSQLLAVPYSLYSLKSGNGSRSIYGSFDTNGNILSGSGFTIRSLGGGRYEVLFNQVFNELPNIGVKLVGAGTYTDKIINRSLQKTTIEITGNPDHIQFEAMAK